MNDAFIKILGDISNDFVHIFTLLVLLLSLTIGLILIFKPDLVTQWNNRFQKKYSLRQQTKVLEEQRNFDRLFYRHHRILGSLLTITSAYSFYYFSMVFEADMFSMILPAYPLSILAIMADWLRILMLFVSTLTLILGATIFLRPSSLKSFEAWANRWISTRQATRPLAKEYQKLDQLVLSHPRFVGIAVVILSIYSAISLILIYN